MTKYPNSGSKKTFCMIQRGERNYLVKYPAVADSKQSKSKMIPFETVFLQFVLQFNHWSF